MSGLFIRRLLGERGELGDLIALSSEGLDEILLEGREEVGDFATFSSRFFNRELGGREEIGDFVVLSSGLSG